MSVTESTSVKWATRRLGDITQVRTGKLDANAQRPGGPYPFFTCGEETLEIDHFAFDTEAILLAGNGNFNVKWYHGKFNAYQRTYVIEPNGVYGKWLFYAVQAALRTITKGNRGSVIRFIRIGDIVDSTVCVPPSDAQQRRIVAEIEKQFTRLEAGVAALRRVQANLKRYRAAVLKAACEGQLVPTEAELQKAAGKGQKEFESGGQLLKRILAERRQHWKGRGQYKEPADSNSSNLPPLPEGWTWSSSSQLLREVKDGTHDTPAYHSAGVPFITQKHIKPSGLVFEDYKFISQEDHQHFYERSNPQRGDILVSMIGVNRGESCIVNTDEIFSIKNVGLFKPNHSLSNGKFIQHYMSSRLGQQLILKQSKGGAQPFIGLTELRAWPIPLPPIAEQMRIVAEVERRLSVVEELESVVSANLQRATRLRQSILQKAFTGELMGEASPKIKQHKV